jgi:uncharacterized protein YndB with AHSA1/START domain
MTATETVLVSEVIPASRHAIYAAWLDTRQHSAFTGDTAVIEPAIGGRHSTFGGYASGTMLELEPHRRIVLSWRSTEFPEGSPDSRLEVTLEDTAGGTLVTILHTQIPEGQGDRYKDGWIQYYLEPLKRYFSKRVSNGVNGHRYGLAYAEKEDHVGDNERENDDDLEMQGAEDQGDLDEEADDQERGDADLDDDDTVLAAEAGDQDDMDDDDSDDLTVAQGDDDEDSDGAEPDDDTVEVGADAIQEVSTEDAHRVVARPMEDDVRSPVLVEDMTGGYDEPAKSKPKAKPARPQVKAAARKPPGKKSAKVVAKAVTKKAAKKATKSAAKPGKKAAKPAPAKMAARAGKSAKAKKAAPKKAAAKRPKAKAKAGAKSKSRKRR